MNLCIYEDTSLSRLLPLAHYQIACDIRCGVFTARERAGRVFPGAPVHLFVRPHLAAVARERHPGCRVNEHPEGAALFINARTLAAPGTLAGLAAAGKGDRLFRIEGRIAACAASASAASRIAETFGAGASGTGMPDEDALEDAVEGLPSEDIPGRMLTFAWECVTFNPEMLIADSTLYPLGEQRTRPDFPGVHLTAPERIFLGPGVTLHPGTVVLAQEGPVIIDEGATILPHTVIIGPAYIGRGSTVKAGAKIYPNTSIGPVCKVGGEVEGSVLHSYANKQHEGFLGHSYLGAWTNIGADTNSSDLKNTYGPIRMVLEGLEYDTGQRFLGLLMADHAKCGINTMFNTGTTVGVGANVFGADYPPKFIPSFSWGGAAGMAEYPLRKCAAVARTVMARRDVAMSPAEEQLLGDIFTATEDQRNNYRNRQPSRPPHLHV